MNHFVLPGVAIGLSQAWPGPTVFCDDSRGMTDRRMGRVNVAKPRILLDEPFAAGTSGMLSPPKAWQLWLLLLSVGCSIQYSLLIVWDSGHSDQEKENMS